MYSTDAPTSMALEEQGRHMWIKVA